MVNAGELIRASDAPGSGSAYTATLSGSTSGGTVGNGTVTGRYFQLGNLVVGWLEVIWGSSTSAGVGSSKYSLPVAARSTTPAHIGTALMIDTSATGRWTGVVELNTVDDCIIVAGAGAGVATQAGGIISSTAPFTWASTDVMRIEFKYEAA